MVVGKSCSRFKNGKHDLVIVNVCSQESPNYM